MERQASRGVEGRPQGRHPLVFVALGRWYIKIRDTTGLSPSYSLSSRLARWPSDFWARWLPGWLSGWLILGGGNIMIGK